MTESFFTRGRSLCTVKNLLILLIAASVPLAGIPLSALLIALGISAFLLLWNMESAPSLTLLDIAVFVFACTCCISTVFAEYRPAAINVLAICISASLLYYCVRYGLFRNAALLIAMGLLSIFYAAIGLIHFINVFDRWRALGFTRLVDFRLYITSIPGLFPNSNPSAFFICALAVSLVATRRWHPARNKFGWLFVFSSIGCFTCLLLSFSRGTYLALVCLAVSYAFFEHERRNVMRALVVGICVLIAVTLSSGAIAKAMLDTVKVRSTTSQQRSINGRLKIAYESAKLALRKPLVGAGLGNFPYALQTHSSYQQTNMVVAESYNLLLNTTVESGILGGGALLLIGAGICMRLYDIRRSRSNPFAAIVGSACVALMLLSLFHSFLFSGRATAFYVYVLLAILAGESELHAAAE
jgi:O-antigen ligase